MRRWSRAGWDARRSPARARSRSTSTPARCASASACCARATGSRSTAATGTITLDDVPLVEPRGLRAVPDGARLVRRAAHARRARQRRHARGRRQGDRARRRGHRPVPHRAHVPRRAPAADGGDDHGRGRRPRGRAAIERLRPLQEADFEQILAALDGRPVTVRLLDPPLHEFLPHPDDLPEGSPAAQARRAAAGVQPDARHARRAPRASSSRRCTRCRCAPCSPPPRACPGARVEVMVPLVAYERELELIRGLIDRVAAEHRPRATTWSGR